MLVPRCGQLEILEDALRVGKAARALTHHEILSRSDPALLAPGFDPAGVWLGLLAAG